MLGDIINALTNPATADEAVATVARPEIVARIKAAADAERVQPGALIARKVRHLMEHGGEDIWLDLLGVMSNTPEPGAAALDRILAYAFPDPVRVRIKTAGKPAAS